MSTPLRRRLTRLADRRQVGWVDVRREVHLYYRTMKIPLDDGDDAEPMLDPDTCDGERTLAAVYPFIMRRPPEPRDR